MSFKIIDNFTPLFKKPLDYRNAVERLEDIKTPYEGLLTYNKSDKSLYKYENGKFKKLSFSDKTNVKDFGAKGDGITDDTQSFKMWVDYLVANSTVGLIPNGNYILSDSIVLPENSDTKIIGENKYTTILNFKDTNYNMIGYGSVKSGDISNITIDANQNVNTTYGCCIYGKNSSNIKIDNIIIKNIGYCGIMMYSDPDKENLNNIKVSECNCYGVGKNIDTKHPFGILIAGADNSIIKNSYCNNINYYSFEFKNDSSNCKMENCTAENCNQAFYLGGDEKNKDFYVNDSSIENCVALNCVSPFFIGQAKNIIIKNCSNTMPSIEKIISVNIRECEHVTISGNYYYDYNGLDLRKSKNVLVNASFFNKGNSGRLLNFVEASESIINVLNTNDTSFRTIDTPKSCIINYVNHFTSCNMLENPKHNIMLGTSEQHNTGNVNIVAPSLKQTFNSSTDSIISNVYGDEKKSFINMDFDTKNMIVKFKFYDSTTSSTKYFTIKGE